jgi:hypothetical protein
VLNRIAMEGYKETKFPSACRGIRVAHITVWISKQQNFGRGKGRRLSASGGLETPDRVRELQRKLYQKAKEEK